MNRSRSNWLKKIGSETEDVAQEDCFKTKIAELIILECRRRATEFSVLSEEIGEYLDELLI